MTTDRNEHQARKLLALGLDEFGHHTEAANVRAGIDLDDYKVELWAILAALNAKPAAAQEAVAFRLLYKTHGGEWSTQGRPWADGKPDPKIVTDAALPGSRWKIEYAYAAPVTAAPARVTVRVAGVGSATLEVVDGCIDLPLDTIMSIAARGTPAAPVAIFQERSTHSVYRGSCGSLPCYCWAENDHIIGDEVKRYSTPAAPGIELEQFRGAVEYALRRYEGEEGYPRGAARMRKLLALIDASHKGGSDARDAARWRHARTILPVSVIEEGQAMLRQFGGRSSEVESARADAAIDAALHSLASDAEVRP